jgi:hypothetical protein
MDGDCNQRLKGLKSLEKACCWGAQPTGRTNIHIQTITEKFKKNKSVRVSLQKNLLDYLFEKRRFLGKNAGKRFFWALKRGRKSSLFFEGA